MKFFDAHCHLQDDALFPNIGKVMARAAAVGVEKMAVCGTSSKDWNEIFQALEKYPQIFPMIGIHPWFVPMIGPEAKRERPRRSDEAATDQGAAIHPWFAGCRAGAVTPPESVPKLRGGCSWKESFQTLEKTVQDFPMVGIGETGLDFQSRFTNRAEQEASFAAHLDLARELNRPVAVHCVQAWGRLVEMLKEHPAPRVLLHAFGGAPDLIPELMELNCCFSFGEAVMNPNAKRVWASAAAVPADHLLIETDSAGEPEKLMPVACAVAELRGVSVDEIAERTFANAQSVFDLPKNSSAMTAHSRPKGR